MTCYFGTSRTTDTIDPFVTSRTDVIFADRPSVAEWWFVSHLLT